MTISNGNTLSENLALALDDRASFDTDGKLLPAIAEQLLVSASERGASQSEAAAAQEWLRKLTERNDPNTALVARLIRIATPELTEPTVDWQDETPDPADLEAWQDEIGGIQRDLAERGPAPGAIARGFHHKQLYAGFAEVVMDPELPGFLRFGLFLNTDPMPAAVRFSNGQSCPFSDAAPDLRGFALKIVDSERQPWDILSTNQQIFVRNARQFMQFARLNADSLITGEDLPAILADAGGDPDSKLGKTLESLRSQGLSGEDWSPGESARIAEALNRETVGHPVSSLATESYDGGTFRLPNGYLGKCLFGAVASQAKPVDRNDDDYLTKEFALQLDEGPVRFTLQVKVYTGNGDPSLAHDNWEPARTYDVGHVEITPMNDQAGGAFSEQVTRMAFNPATGFEPALMSHARSSIYTRSASNRGAMSDEGAVEAILAAASAGIGR